MAESHRIKKYGPVVLMLALIAGVVPLAMPYSTKVMTALGFEQQTVTKTVWVAPWWMDALSVGIVLFIIAVVLYAPAVMPRGGFNR